MQSEDDFAKWAAMFVRTCSEDAGGVDAPGLPALEFGGLGYPGLTPAAGELLRTVDGGGVPAFVTAQLKQIALDNGIEVSPVWTPNEIVAALRAKVSAGPPTPVPGAQA